MRLLINASAAKFGGAKTIIESFVNNADLSIYSEVVLVAPQNIKVRRSDIRHIKLETNGFITYLFSVVGILMLVVFFKSNRVISFNNVNLVIPFIDTKTYFHNLKILTQNNLRFKILRMTIRLMMKKRSFVFQTHFVRNCFENVFGRNFMMEVCWCGCQIPGVIKRKNKIEDRALRAISPIMDIDSKNKNFDFLLRNQQLFQNQNISLDITSEGDQKREREAINFIGVLKYEELLNRYDSYDFMIICSFQETVCLPIFEYASTGKPVLVLDQPYIRGIAETVSLTKNIIIFNEFELKDVLSQLSVNYSSYLRKPLPVDHELVSSNWAPFEQF